MSQTRPYRENVRWIQGDTLQFQFTFNEDGSALDLSGKSEITAILTKERDLTQIETNNEWKKTLTDGDITLSGAGDNVISATATEAEMSLGSRRYYFIIFFDNAVKQTEVIFTVTLIDADKGNSSASEWTIDIDTTADTVSGQATQQIEILDEDDMSSDSATAVPTQQSAKAYVNDKASLLGIDSVADNPYATNQKDTLNVRGNGSLHPIGATAHPTADFYGCTVAFIFDNGSARELIERTDRSGVNFYAGGFKELFDNLGVKYALSTPTINEDSNAGVTLSERLNVMQANGFEQMLHVRANDHPNYTTAQADAWLATQLEEQKDAGLDLKAGNWLQGGSTPAFRYAIRKHLNAICQVTEDARYNRLPINQYNLCRVPMDTGDYNDWIEAFELAYADGGFIIFYGHADERFQWDTLLDDDGNADAGGDYIWEKVERLIEYIQAKADYGNDDGVQILPFSEAIDRYDNVIDVGFSKEIIAPENSYTRISKSGKLSSDVLDQIDAEAFPVGHARYNEESLRIGRWAKINEPIVKTRQTAIGHRSGDFNEGINQSALGFEAGASNTGDRQTAVGDASGKDNSGDFQVAIGNNAGRSNNQNNQTVAGYNAGRDNIGLNQTAVGYQAGYQNEGEYQTVLGTDAGSGNTGARQTAMGKQAGAGNTGGQNVSVGYESGLNNNQGDSTFVGYWSGRSNIGADSSFLGSTSGFSNTGARAHGFGRNSARSNSGSDVVAVGWGSGWTNSGNNCVFFGREAGRDNTVHNRLLVEARNITTNPLMDGDFEHGGLAIGAPATADKLDDTRIGANRFTFYLDEAGNNLTVRVKYADGTTIKEGTIGLA